MGVAVELTEDTFEAEVLKSEVPVLVDFWAEWCGPCKMIGPIVEKLAGTYAGRLKVCKANVDHLQSVAARYQVMSIPNLLFFKEGAVANQVVGYVPEDQLASKIDSVLG
ncbi:MAG: thioredoxin [Armatimonadetes bacterium CG_4_10_14_3_um_filter_66_18]|nr:thioredoxin [Armatimonadota bacterium]OIO98140.1 MAG: thioredoxin [Armatimonadetes bacterium CG2_30_66_41]PIU95248.1 MAG: thioredoxin [Armatimonadetes bacterium CG06_land_8_20_14_3_00_66_21]PIX45222.1 MAG: thioredoxin [Armatimonadetes bacterium CG_4_8_14_3_um_filter_66_20]PIY48564.1 MAG: thioredoxin [Armatimonadetes bacterium CG_4_10_14_3_um_filter_66_18]PIZ47246.1 MAG: thioredoxin [Armatimonadetes bacterium CG_4_10_14_0_8_um_filter_66_14]PJB74045.1 MAG: thioredoxin [Armatimonadetes bacter